MRNLPVNIMEAISFAHSENSAGIKHDLVDHLKGVADLAASFADKLGAADLGYWAGLWHDLGKIHPGFQTYLQADSKPPRGPDHKGVGAVVASQYFEPLAFLVAGHHGGLPSRADLKNWLREKMNSPYIQEALLLARQQLSPIEPGAPLSTPAHLRSDLDVEFFLRMLFSALTDADFLDTERHFHPDKFERRGGAPGLKELWERFVADQQRLTGKQTDRVNILRHEVYEACLRGADMPPGIFRLTVPTGGGKTRSSMAFALSHALKHSLDRVTVAIPYTSIIEQTAWEYREIFGSEAVLEHHSAVVPREDAENPQRVEIWMRLSSENWDAPIVVTTTVQLFESLFANRPSYCRKLHNLAQSVLILDEVQTLPTHLLVPILDGIQHLADHYRVTVLLCTATQPALMDGPYIKGLRDVREIVPDPSRYFTALRRVHYEHPRAGEQWPWRRVAEEMRTSSQCMAVVNTKRDAFALLDALGDPAALHLSTQMCGTHRLETLRQVRHRLAAGEPCRLISTQVVEAGVDLDFPLVLRAVGPLDRIVQAAGRCNREGRLEQLGRVVIFDPAEGSSPPGIYRTGIETAASLLATGCDLHDPRTYETYFHRLFQAADLDSKRIQEVRRTFDFPAVAQKFRMIEDDSVPAVVRPEGHAREVDRLLALIRGQEEVSRWVFRRLQPYLVSIRSRLLPDYEKNGLLREVVPGLYEWLGAYDRVRGLLEEERAREELVI